MLRHDLYEADQLIFFSIVSPIAYTPTIVTMPQRTKKKMPEYHDPDPESASEQSEEEEKVSTPPPSPNRMNAKGKRKPRKKKATKPEELAEPDPESDAEDTPKPKKKAPKKPRKPSAWVAHVKAYRAEHPEVSYKEALKAASKTYKKATKA